MRIKKFPFDLEPVGQAEWVYDIEDDSLKVFALPHSDIYINPAGKNSTDAASLMNASTLLGIPPSGDFQFSAKVTVDFKSQFDAGVLMIWVDELNWVKFCFEYSPDGTPMVVSVVTINFSDDANSFTVNGNSIWYRITRRDNVYALHAAIDGTEWLLIRVFTLGPEIERHKLGFAAQSPTGEGCNILFNEVNFSQTRLEELRDGS
jgi:regulation of enolase protein 1 (concanavalin A-like superfamily)